MYGEVGKFHAAAYHQHPQTEVVGICDIQSEALWDFKKPDVSVVAPDHLHADITVEAARGSVRAVLCEKQLV